MRHGSFHLCSCKAGDVAVFVELFRIARAEGLGVTLHIAEVRLLAEWDVFPQVQVCEGMTSRQTRENSTAETKTLLSCEPERLGHATFLDEELKEVVLARRTCIEICLTSNLLCVFPFFALWPPPSVSHRALADAKR
jgi:adenosine deaminase